MPETPHKPERGHSPAPSILHPLMLGFLLVVVPTGLLAALAGSVTLNLQWQNANFQAFLFTCSAAVSLLISYLLNREFHLSRHPATLVLAMGFAGTSMLHVVSGWTTSGIYLTWLDAVAQIWLVVFAAVALVMIGVRPVRRFARRATERSIGVCWAAGSGVFLLSFAAGLFFSRKHFSDPAAMGQIHWHGMPSVVAVSIITAFVFRLYLRRRTSVMLALSLALGFYALAVTALTLSSTWTLLWWYAHSLIFASLVLAADGVLEGTRVRERDQLIQQLADLTKKLEEQSVRDPLTGCFNRRYALHVLDSEFRKAFRAKLPLTLMVADADDFKRLNDTYGHLFGDFVLCELVRRLSETIRTSDVLARCGGEEFYLVLPLTNRTGGRLLANKLLQSMRATPFEHDGSSSAVSLSIGIADNMTPGVNDVTTLIAAADRALYVAKSEGKNRAVVNAPLEFALPHTSGQPE